MSIIILCKLWIAEKRLLTILRNVASIWVDNLYNVFTRKKDKENMMLIISKVNKNVKSKDAQNICNIYTNRVYLF